MTAPSYPPPGYPAPAPRSRPTVVTVASNLLFAVAALEVINAIAAFTTVGPVTDAIKDVYAGTPAEGAEGIVTFGYIGGAVVNLLFAAGFAILGILDGRGKNPARIITWVVGGISLCCVGAGLGGNAVAGSLESGSSTGGPSQTEVQQRLDAALPSWYTPVSTTIAVVVLLAILATIILLALPASNEFFRKRVAGGFDPNVPYPTYPYPGQPGYPPAGQPPYPGQPGPGPGPAPGPGSGPGYGQPGPGPGQPGQFGQQGQPGQPAPGLPPYPGQTGQPPSGLPSYPGQAPSSPTSPPPPSDPFAPPPATGEEPPRPPA